MQIRENITTNYTFIVEASLGLLAKTLSSCLLSQLYSLQKRDNSETNHNHGETGDPNVLVPTISFVQPFLSSITSGSQVW